MTANYFFVKFSNIRLIGFVQSCQDLSVICYLLKSFVVFSRNCMINYFCKNVIVKRIIHTHEKVSERFADFRYKTAFLKWTWQTIPEISSIKVYGGTEILSTTEFSYTRMAQTSCLPLKFRIQEGYRNLVNLRKKSFIIQ